MRSSFMRLRDQNQVPQNSIKISNYIYYPDLILGEGNYSTVYQAISKKTKQKIAAKVINLTRYSNPKMLQLLDQQIQTLLTLDHPNIIKCYDILKTSEYCYCFTEFCEGGTLAKKLSECGRMSQNQAWPYIRDAYQALNYLHSKNIIHRDIKTANIFLKEGRAKLADFGFAVQSKLPFKDLSIGSPFYMTPQGFIDGMYTMKTDVWAFGMLVYELLHGSTPFSSIEDPKILTIEMKKQLQLDSFRADLSYEVKKLLRQCLQIDQAKRISTPQIQFTDFMQKYLNREKKLPTKGSTRAYEYKYVTQANRNKSYANINTTKLKKQTDENKPQIYVYNSPQHLQVPKINTGYMPYSQYCNHKVIRLQSTVKVHEEQRPEPASPSYYQSMYYHAKMKDNVTTVIHPITIK